MKRKMLIVLASVSCLMLPTCINLDTDALGGLIGDAACGVVTSGLPGGVNWCSVIDIDLGAGND